jgi:hypothetical protein
VVVYVLDDALRLMNERAGLPYGSGMRWSKRVRGWCWCSWCFSSSYRRSDLFEPPPPQLATYGPDSLWTGADTARLIDIRMRNNATSFDMVGS